MAIQPYVFISYSSENTAIAEHLAQYLGSQGIPYWISSKCIPPGTDYTVEIPRAISGCCAVVLVLTAEAQKSQWIPKELDTAVNTKKPILPIHMDAAPLNSSYSFRFSNVQWIEGNGRQKEAYKELADRLRGFMTQQPAPSPKAAPTPTDAPAPTLIPCSYKDKVTGGTNSGSLRLFPDRLVFYPTMGQESALALENITACSWPSTMVGKYWTPILGWLLAVAGLLLCCMGFGFDDMPELIAVGAIVAAFASGMILGSRCRILLTVTDKNQKLLWRRRNCVITNIPKNYRRALLAYLKNNLKCRMPGV